MYALIGTYGDATITAIVCMVALDGSGAVSDALAITSTDCEFSREIITEVGVM